MCLKRLKIALGKVENILGKGENADYLFPKCFHKDAASFLNPFPNDKFYTLPN